MSPNPEENTPFIRLKSKIISEGPLRSTISVPMNHFPSPSEVSSLKVQSKLLNEWNPYGEPETCMICWKPLDLLGKDARSFMECRHCHRKAHQQHMLRWLSRKNHCPYCQNKW